MVEKIRVDLTHMWGKEFVDGVKGSIIVDNTKEGRLKAIDFFELDKNETYGPDLNTWLDDEDEFLFIPHLGDYDEPTGFGLTASSVTVNEDVVDVMNEVVDSKGLIEEKENLNKVSFAQKEKINDLRSQAIKTLSELEFEVEAMRRRNEITADQYVDNIERFQDSKAKISFACDDVTLM